MGGKGGINYGVRGVSQIKFTMSDPFLVLYDFDILSMIKRKNLLVFIVAFHFSNSNFDFQSLSRLICQMTLLISKIYRV